MTDAALPLSGYLDRFSHRPGETFTGYVSQREPGPYRIRLERVVSGDPNPDGPGMRLDDLSDVLDLPADGNHQPIALGSHARIGRTPSRGRTLAMTWTALVWPGDVSDGQAVMHERDEHRSVLLSVGESSTAAVVNGTISVNTGAPMHQADRVKKYVTNG